MKNIPRLLSFYLTCAVLACVASPAATVPALATDQTNYNVGDQVLVRFYPAAQAVLSIRYAGDSSAVADGFQISGDAYHVLWTIPASARTGRYLVDATTSTGKISSIASFAVHRQLAKVITFDLDKTFYTAGDTVNPRIIVQNISNRRLEHLQVEFEAYTYPWIAPAADEPPAWKTVADSSLSLEPGEIKEFRLKHAAVLQAGEDETYVYFSAVIRDGLQPDRIYDLAFALPAITSPLTRHPAKSYPFLYLYRTLKDVPKSESYRQFYPPAYVSDTIRFDTAHTMFLASPGASPAFSFRVAARPGTQPASISYRVLNSQGKVLTIGVVQGPVSGQHPLVLGGPQASSFVPGAYTLEISLLTAQGVALASNRLDFAVNTLPKSILIFCAHEDDDTAHPEIIRAAVENHIPIHFVYFTSGDAGGCDRYFMHSCDAARALEFGEVRMDEARASLGHLGVPADNIYFLGLPDGGMEQIWKNYPASAQPYLSVLLASEHSPYADAAVPNLPYARDAVLQATRGFIERFQPDMIITGHPDERHVDHRTNNWFVVKAMQELVKQGKLSAETQLVVDAVYGPGPTETRTLSVRQIPVLCVRSGGGARAGSNLVLPVTGRQSSTVHHHSLRKAAAGCTGAALRDLRPALSAFSNLGLAGTRRVE